VASLVQGDCLKVLKQLEACSVDSVVTDPPYGIAFMGKDWDSFRATNEAKSQVVKGLGTGMRMTTAQENRDYQEWCREWAEECFRVLKPGGWLLSFGGTRMYHRLAAGIEDANFELRDTIAWVYGSGFPKSMNVGKAIDKAAGAEREVVGGSSTLCPDFPGPCKGHPTANGSLGGGVMRHAVKSAPATAEAAQWEGWGTALKPALEPITLARKPLTGTVAANVLKHGTGALNIDGCRVGDEVRTYPLTMTAGNFETTGGGKNVKSGEVTVQGRWPANLIHDGSEEVVELFGPAARFFYCPKAAKKERDLGCEDLPIRRPDERTETGMGTFVEKGVLPGRNHHPTVKPVELMRYLCRLVTPPGGLVLDPFCGSGTTGVAASLEGFEFLGIEREDEYLEIARRRLGLPDPELAVANAPAA
jgi:site-specific DNA-methyltransferase (adenine-specific)